jgi:transposase-like protein
VRRVEDITEALWGTRVSPATVSDLNKKIYGAIEAWRNRPIEGEHPYVFLDGIVLKRTWAGEVRNVSLLVAIGVNSQGFRDILGICEGAKEDKAGWSAFLKHLKERGLKGVRLIISDACLGLAESAAEFFSGGRVATVRGSLVQKYLQPRALDQGPRGRGDAQGDPCWRRRCGGTRKGPPGD